jgi:WD40 repeat protein
VRDHDGDRADTFFAPTHATSDGRFLVGPAAVHFHPLSIWDLHDRRAVRDLRSTAPSEALGPFVVSADGQRIAGGMENGFVLLWTREAKPIPVAARHAAVVERLTFSPDARYLASSSHDGVVYVSDASTGATLGDVRLVADRATFLWFQPDVPRLVIRTARGFEVTVSVRR